MRYTREAISRESISHTLAKFPSNNLLPADKQPKLLFYYTDGRNAERNLIKSSDEEASDDDEESARKQLQKEAINIFNKI